MSSTVARITTISSRSTESFDHAIREGVERAHATLRNVSGAWVKDQKVECTDGAIGRSRRASSPRTPRVSRCTSDPGSA